MKLKPFYPFVLSRSGFTLRCRRAATINRRQFMNQYQKQKAPSDGARITLSDLKEQLYTLNMQMLLAIQCRDEKTQEEIRKKMEELQKQMERLSMGERLSS